MADSKVKIVKIPKTPFSYQGNQVIINTDRVVMQSKKDSILAFANEHMSFSANGSIHFDTSDADTSYFIINSPKMIFGLENKGAKLPTEPALLGDKTEEWLKDVLVCIDALCDILSGCQNTDSADDVPSATLVGALNDIIVKKHLKSLGKKIGYKQDGQGNFEKMKGQKSTISSKRIYLADNKEE
tara:strand:- start:478 stop:1032 length:555 start_codon:yes stop_codon:yes gene_type:complete